MRNQTHRQQIDTSMICNLSHYAVGPLASDDYLDYRNKIHSFILHQEAKYLPATNYFRDQPHINAKHRERMVSRLIFQQVTLGLQPETLFITVNIMDRYLSRKRLSEEQLELLAISALFVASKF